MRRACVRGSVSGWVYMRSADGTLCPMSDVRYLPRVIPKYSGMLRRSAAAVFRRPMSTAALPTAHVQRVTRLYRRSLKNLLNWVVWRDLWIEKGFELRAEFDAQKNVTDPRLIEKLVSDAEAKLAEYQHPDPYKALRHKLVLPRHTINDAPTQLHFKYPRRI